MERCKTDEHCFPNNIFLSELKRFKECKLRFKGGYECGFKSPLLLDRGIIRDTHMLRKVVGGLGSGESRLESVQGEVKW